MTRVLVVDDEPQVTSALDGALTRTGYEVALASDGERGVELAATWSPDLVVLDLSMPGLPGLDVISRVRAWSDVPILVLSGLPGSERRVEALDAGADDYLQKPFGLDELQARLRALVRRAVRDEVEVTHHFVNGLEVDLAHSRVSIEAREVRLTPTEWRVLRALVTHPDRLLTHRWLLQEVWGGGHGEETRDALRTHVRALRAKIKDQASSPLYIRTESGSGYRWIAPLRGADRVEIAAVATPAYPGELLHELANATTALRIAVQLMTRSLASEVPGTSPADTHEYIDALTARVARLVSALAEQEQP